MSKKKCIFFDNFFFLLQSGRTPSCTEWEMSPYVPTRNKYWQELCARENSYHMSGLLTLSLPPPSSDSKDRVFYVTGILYCFSAGFRCENSSFFSWWTIGATGLQCYTVKKFFPQTCWNFDSMCFFVYIYKYMYIIVIGLFFISKSWKLGESHQ